MPNARGLILPVSARRRKPIATSSNTVLLLKMEGADGGTSFTDSGPSAHTITASGGVTSTAEFLYGSSSMLAASSGNKITTPWDADFDFGTGPFTVELSYYSPTQPTASYDIIYGWHASTAAQRAWSVAFLQVGTTLQLQFFMNKADGSGSEGFTRNFTYAASTWYQFAFSCDGSGGNIRAYADGVYLNGLPMTGSGGNLIWHSSGVLATRIDPLEVSRSNVANARYDELRITKGVALYGAANYTPGPLT